MQTARTLCVSIQRSPREVFEFVRNPENLPVWAGAFCRSAQKDGSRWLIETPAGPIEIRFVEDNAFGVLDHFVTASDGRLFFNPMRVVANAGGSEVTFTVFQSQDVTDEQFATDFRMVESDLQTLKAVLETH